MARLFTSGAEAKDSGTVNLVNLIDGYRQGTGTLTFDTGTVRSGACAFKYASGAGGSAISSRFAFTGVASRNYYMRFYVNSPGLPTATATIWQSDAVASTSFLVKMTTTGTLQLFAGTTQVGSDSAALSTNTWYRVEVHWNIGTGATDAADLLLDGTSVASTTTANITDTASALVVWGLNTAGGTNNNLFIDDVALNDDQGASQNTYPGDGKVVLLLPTSDAGVGTGWTNDAGGTATLNVDVDNIPPIGITDTSSGTGLNQVRNATSNANVTVDENMTTYTAAGVPAGATIKVIDPIVATAAPVVTSAKQGLVGVVSNPAITAIALGAGGTAGAFWSGVAGGTYPTGWKISHGTITYAPAVTLGTAPVMRIQQVTASTRIAVCCFMGIYVDYTPAAAAAVIPDITMAPLSHG
jgi:hypothetical protein